MTLNHWIALRAELAAHPRTNATLGPIGGALLSDLGLPTDSAQFEWAALATHFGMTSLLQRPVRVQLSNRLTPEQATETLFHELAHVVAFLAGEGRGIDPGTGHHGLVFETATQLLCETFGLPPVQDPRSWPRIAWQSRVSLVGEGWR